MSTPELLIVATIGMTIYFLWRILQRMGFSGALALLFLIPIVNLLLLGWLSITPWPLEKKTTL